MSMRMLIFHGRPQTPTDVPKRPNAFFTFLSASPSGTLALGIAIFSKSTAHGHFQSSCQSYSTWSTTSSAFIHQSRNWGLSYLFTDVPLAPRTSPLLPGRPPCSPGRPPCSPDVPLAPLFTDVPLAPLGFAGFSLRFHGSATTLNYSIFDFRAIMNRL